VYTEEGWDGKETGCVCVCVCVCREQEGDFDWNAIASVLSLSRRAADRLDAHDGVLDGIVIDENSHNVYGTTVRNAVTREPSSSLTWTSRAAATLSKIQKITSVVLQLN
jgi:hypothetical protein